MGGERADVIVVYGSINQSDFGVLVVGVFDMVFERVQIDEDGIVCAGQFEFGMAAVAGVGLEAKRVADIANSTTHHTQKEDCTCLHQQNGRNGMRESKW